MEYTTDLLEILNNIDPFLLDYQEWCNVGGHSNMNVIQQVTGTTGVNVILKDIIKMNAIENGSLLLVQV